MLRTILTYLFAFIMLAGAVGHFFKPGFYNPMVPPFVPEWFANWVAGIAELAIGLALIQPRLRKRGALGFTLLMVAFVPLHIWDLFRPDPVMGSSLGAMVRLAVQGLLIYGGYWLWKKL